MRVRAGRAAGSRAGRPGRRLPLPRRVRRGGRGRRGDGLPAARRGDLRAGRRAADELPHLPLRAARAGPAARGRDRARARRGRRHRHRCDAAGRRLGCPGHRRRVVRTTRRRWPGRPARTRSCSPTASGMPSPELTGGRGVDVVVDPVGGDRFTDSLRSPRARRAGCSSSASPPARSPRSRSTGCCWATSRVVGVGWGAWWTGRGGPGPGFLRHQWDDLVPLLESGARRPGHRRGPRPRGRRGGAHRGRRAPGDRQDPAHPLTGPPRARPDRAGPTAVRMSSAADRRHGATATARTTDGAWNRGTS